LLRAIIFDFDGILVNSEPLILKLTQAMAAREGWTVTDEEYYRDYLALDDRGIVEHLYRTHGQTIDPARRDEVVAWKGREYWKLIEEGLPPLPGAVEFVRTLARRYPLAIASGSLRVEIGHLLAKLGLAEAFQLMVTADDVERSKPSPEVFFKALAALGRLPSFQPPAEPLCAAECLVIEDAPGGIQAAHAAGMRVLALAHSRPIAELATAEWVHGDYSEIDFGAVQAAFGY
jgi:HAD superfamily hydrolase (TIGR01509 family)